MYFLLTDCISIYPVRLFDNSSMPEHANFSLDFKRWLKPKILVSYQVIRVPPANVCLCMQAAISEHLPHAENHQSADCAPPWATRLLWLPHNGWWQRLKNATPSSELMMMILTDRIHTCSKVILSFHFPLPETFFVCIQIMFDNRAHSGKIKVDVENDVRIYECRDWNVEGTCKF